MRHRDEHQNHRQKYSEAPIPRAMGALSNLFALHKNGEEIPVEISLSPIYSNGRQLYAAAIRDISDKQKAEKAIEEHNRLLQTKNQELEHFTYLASHDLQEPIRSLLSLTQLLQKKLTDQSEADTETYFRFMKAACIRMQDQINGLLELSKIGKERSITIVETGPVLSDVLHDLDVSIKESKAKIYFEKPLPILKGNRTEIRLLFQNLISNAIKYKKADAQPIISIRAKEKEAEIQFSISDNGIGIHPEHHEKVFVLFKRLHNRNEYSGTGIGLAHCQKIVHTHGGKIWIESEPNTGSTFHFSIPKSSV
jgi:light-regulated signal transduction histidine kinase (bacteriophytochrome)